MAPLFQWRFAILSAVSSEKQAREDKASLDDQIKTARQFAASQGGTETCKPYRLDGYSRTGYVDLTRARKDIPPLDKCLCDAEADKYDVLIVDNIERFGDLAPMVYTLFHGLQKQIISARQPTPVQDPGTYNHWNDESGDIMQSVSRLYDRYRKNKLQRGWTLGIPARVKRGLQANNVSHGYKRVAPDQPAQQIPEICRVLVRMKDKMLEGESYIEIGKYADKQGIRTRRGCKWHPSVVKNTLLNPYYAGIVLFNRNKKRVPLPRSEWVQGKGRHKPLWDETTYLALVAEAKRRLDGKKNYTARYPFSGLLVCGVCGRKISKHGTKWEYMACKSYSHWHRPYAEAVSLFTKAIVTEYKKFKSQPYKPVDLSPLKDRLKQLDADEEHVQAMTRAGVYKIERGAKEIQKIDEERAEVRDRLQRVQDREVERLQRTKQRDTTDIDTLPELIARGEPRRVNQLLRVYIEKIVAKGEDITIYWRE